MLGSSGVYAPSLISELKWVPYTDGVRYMNMSEDTFEYYINARGIEHEYRDFRGCVCVTLDTLLKIAIWRSIKDWTHRRLSLEMMYGLGELPGPVLVELLRVLHNPNSRYLDGTAKPKTEPKRRK